jgi:WD40 repeat protein
MRVTFASRGLTLAPLLILSMVLVVSAYAGQPNVVIAGLKDASQIVDVGGVSIIDLCVPFHKSEICFAVTESDFATWDLAMNKRLNQVTDSAAGVCATCSYDGQLLLHTAADGRLHARRGTDGREIWNTQLSGAQCLALSSDLKSLAVSRNKRIEIWDMHMRESIAVITTAPGSARAIRFSRDGKRLLVQLDYYAVQLVMIATGETKTYKPNRTVGGIAFSDDGKSYFCGTCREELRPNTERTFDVFDCDICEIDIVSNDVERRVKGHSGCITSLETSGDGHLLSGSMDHTARLWRLSDGAEIWRVDVGAAATWAVFASSGRSVVVASSEKFTGINRDGPRVGLWHLPEAK